jgi:hypothetical protein
MPQDVRLRRNIGRADCERLRLPDAREGATVAVEDETAAFLLGRGLADPAEAVAPADLKAVPPPADVQAGGDALADDATSKRGKR